MLLISRALIATDNSLTLAAKERRRWWSGWWTNDHRTRNPPPLLALAAQAMAQEARRDYLLRLLTPIKRFDSAWSKVDLGKLSGDALRIATDSIMGAAMTEAP